MKMFSSETARNENKCLRVETVSIVPIYYFHILLASLCF